MVKRISLVDPYVADKSFFLAKIPIGRPLTSEHKSHAYVLCQAENGDFFYYETIGFGDYPPQHGHVFDSADEASQWFEEEALKWVRVTLAA